MIVIIALQVGLAANAFAAGSVSNGFVWWSGGAGSDKRWTSGLNWWGTGGAPVFDQNSSLDAPVPLFAVINTACPNDPCSPGGVGITCYDLHVGDWSQSSPNTATLDINNQTLNVTRDLMIGVRETTYWPAGNKSIGDVNVYNGSVVKVGRDLWVGSEGVGSLEVNSNSDINIAGTLRCPGGPQPTYAVQRYTYGTGKITLYGGSIEANDIYSYSETGNEVAQIDIRGGTLKLNGDKILQIADLISLGKLYSSIGDIVCDYNVTNAGKTTIGCIADPNIAYSPIPGNFAQDVSADANLSWKPATSGAAASHNIYFSKSFVDVNDGNASAYQGIQVLSDSNYDPSPGGNLDSNQVYYWRIDEANATQADPNYWKGRVWKFTTKDPYIASNPRGILPPPINYFLINNKTNIDVNVTLSWTKGIAAQSHNVYIGTDAYSVDTATTPTGTTTEPNYHPTGGFTVNWTYYWRIDEVNTTDGNVWHGPVWKFSTQANRPIDNFDTGPISWGATTGSGATIFASPATPTFPASDFNAMRVDYSHLASPWYSEVYAKHYQNKALLKPSERDWTLGGVKVLGISFHGEPNNTTIEPLYVTVKDGSGHSVTLWYPDANDVNQQPNENWYWWPIDLQTLSSGGINLSDVNAIFLGLGDKVSPGGSGRIYFDTIALYPAQCRNLNGDADLNDDCMVDVNDLVIMVQDWLKKSYQVTATTPPSSTGLVLWYQFNEGSGGTATDSSGNGYNGTFSVGNPTWDPCGYDGNSAIVFGGSGNVYLDVAQPDAYADVNLGGHSTVSFWLKDYGQPAGKTIFQMGDSDRGNLQVWSGWTGSFAYRCGEDPCTNFYDEVYWGVYNYTNSEHILGQWNHYAFVKDHTIGSNGQMRIYHNGIVVAEYSDANAPTMPALIPDEDYFTIGAWQYADQTGGYYSGSMDDFRLYKRALSDAEVLYLYLNGSGSITQPVLSGANVVADSQVNFKDFAVMADLWLTNPLLWP
jgi:hypothetical protein